MPKLILSLILTLMIFMTGCVTVTNTVQPIWPNDRALDQMQELNSDDIDNFLQDLWRHNKQLK